MPADYSYTRSLLSSGLWDVDNPERTDGCGRPIPLANEIVGALATPLLAVSCSGGGVVLSFAAALSAEDKTTLDGVVAAHRAGGVTNGVVAKKAEDPDYREELYNASGLLTRRTFFTDAGMTVKHQQREFTYDGSNDLATETLRLYDAAGVEASAVSWTYTVTAPGGGKLVSRSKDA